MSYATSREIAEIVKRRVKYGTTRKMIAKEMGISQGYLSDFLLGNREAGPKILTAMGYEVEPRYRKVRP